VPLAPLVEPAAEAFGADSPREHALARRDLDVAVAAVVRDAPLEYRLPDPGGYAEDKAAGVLAEAVRRAVSKAARWDFAVSTTGCLLGQP